MKARAYTRFRAQRSRFQPSDELKWFIIPSSSTYVHIGRKTIELVAQARPAGSGRDVCLSSRAMSPAVPPPFRTDTIDDLLRARKGACCIYAVDAMSPPEKVEREVADIIQLPECQKFRLRAQPRPHGRGASVSCRSATYNVNNEMSVCILVCTVRL